MSAPGQKAQSPVAAGQSADETTNGLNFATGQRPDKAFQTLRAAFAMNGHALHRRDPADGPVSYWATRWGLARHLPTLHDAALFLAQIGGRL